jgi:hypothetical protein
LALDPARREKYLYSILFSLNSSLIRRTIMNMQKAFEKSENTAVIYAVAAFIVFHFGMLFLFGLV